MGIKTDFKRVDLDAFTANDLVGTWVNELGSKMVVEHVNGVSFTGSYESAVSEDEDPVSGSVVGTLAGDCIGFAVNWKPTFSSVTSFTGKVFHDHGGALRIYTLWQLSRGVKSDADFWQSFLAGSDVFTKLA